ncbi:MAG: hypothetical protein GF308_06540 [Candidatus Heimdallarchaeota archaeon]|nr:hypothetical protein [Candidatus Heimdallarchaeota archaeon]
MEDKSAEIRGRTVLALGRVGNKEILPQLLYKMKEDSDPKVRSRAAWALGTLGQEAKSATEEIWDASKEF